MILPDSVTIIDGSSFLEAPVAYLKWTAGIPVFPKSEFNNYRKVDIYGQNAYSGYSSLKEVVLPEGITEIEEADNFVNGAFYQTPLEKITIPSTLTKIGDYAFYGCSSLTDIKFQGSYRLKTIRDYAFTGCTSLTEPGFQYGLESIGSYAFSDTGISTVILPDSVITVDGSSFRGSPVTYLKWTAGIPVFPKSEFNNYLRGTNAGNASSDYSLLKEVVLPAGVTEIEDADIYLNGAFYQTPLEKITIPLTLTKIGEYAFYGCENLTGVYYNGPQEIRTALLTIGSDNTELEEVDWHYTNSDGFLTLPSNLTSIQNQAFLGTSLIVVDIPASVTGIGDEAFASTESLRALLFRKGNVNLGADVLKNSSNAVVICPAGGTVEVWCAQNNVTCITY